ncbi:MAG: hypothetical protein RQ736_04250 [Thiogranum sp.]|nr:hypothetical protein [Thiogranum sp.]
MSEPSVIGVEPLACGRLCDQDRLKLGRYLESVEIWRARQESNL